MQHEHPLTPTLSPATGERERIRGSQRDSLNGACFQNHVKGFPLPIRWGEGQGEGPRRLNSDSQVTLSLI